MHKLGIIVPYRDRSEQLETFKEAMVSTLRNLDYEIIIVEQEDDNDFNRGKLLNIGFIKATRLNCDYVVFHDIDLIPEKVDYSYSESVQHLIGELNLPKGFNRVNFDEYFGGATLFPVNIFETVNGYSNTYYGWGFEDDDLMLRCIKHNVELKDKVVIQKQQTRTSLSFNGKDSFVAVPNILNANRSYTISVDFTVDNIKTDPDLVTDVFSIFSIPGRDTALIYNSFRNFSYQFWKKDLSSMSITTDHTPPASYNATIVFSVEPEGRRVRFYLNGDRVGTKLYDKAMALPSKYMYLGVGDPEREEKPNYFAGTVSTFTIWKEVLDHTAIKNIANNKDYSLLEISNRCLIKEPDLYYDTKFVKGKQLIDLSGNEHHGTCFNTVSRILETGEETIVKIPNRRPGVFSALKHDENGYTDGYWKTWQSRENQIRYYKSFYDKKYTGENDGLNNLHYTPLEEESTQNIHHLKVALT